MYNKIVVGNSRKTIIDKDINLFVKILIYITVLNIFLWDLYNLNASSTSFPVAFPSLYAVSYSARELGPSKVRHGSGAGAGIVEGPAAYGVGAGIVERTDSSEITSNRLFFSSAFILSALAV